MVSDPIADFITQVVNAGAARKETISVPYSKQKHAMADKLVALGYLKSAVKRGKKVKKMLDVELMFNEAGEHHIRGTKRISKPSRRMYIGADAIHPVKFGAGTLVLSTSQGILTGEEARAARVGGEQLFIIW